MIFNVDGKIKPDYYSDRLKIQPVKWQAKS